MEIKWLALTPDEMLLAVMRTEFCRRQILNQHDKLLNVHNQPIP